MVVVAFISVPITRTKIRVADTVVVEEMVTYNGTDTSKLVVVVETASIVFAIANC